MRARGLAAARERPAWLKKLASYPLLHRFLEPDPEDAEEPAEDDADGKKKKAPKALAVKCDFCADRAEMACIYNCPCGAIDRIDPRVLLA